MKEKKLLRKEMQAILASIDKGQYQQWSREIAEKLYVDESWKNSHTIGIIVSKMPEVNTIGIIQQAWKEGKRVVVPKCLPDTRAMTFHEITSFNQLEVVYYGLREPIIEKTKQVEKEEIELILVPGLMYTRNGYRLGFGGGYYDRFLVDYKGHTITLAFSEQIVSELPIESFDIPVEKIITNKEVIKCDH